MANGHLNSCECSECVASRGQRAPADYIKEHNAMIATTLEQDFPLTPPPPTIANLDAVSQLAEIRDSPAYVISVGGIPRIVIIGGDSEFVLKQLAGNMVFSVADDEAIDQRDSQIFAVTLRGPQQLVLALNAAARPDLEAIAEVAVDE